MSIRQKTDNLAVIEETLEEQGFLGREEALLVLESSTIKLSALLEITDRLRQNHSGNKVRLCSIVNAKSGFCSEDCSFCAQSAHYNTGVQQYPLMQADELVERAGKAMASGATEFSIVTSGASIRNYNELEVLEDALAKIKQGAARLKRCASLGHLNIRQLKRLKASGLQCFHHNLEANRSFFPEICTTHSYEDRVEMVRAAKSEGFRVCSGGIFGMGETCDDRVDLALELKTLDVDSIPVNFLHPIEGTPLAKKAQLTPEICLRIIAMFRLVLPDKDILICGGREYNIGVSQSKIFQAGANGMLIGDYLTTSGRDCADDLKMIGELGLEPV